MVGFVFRGRFPMLLLSLGMLNRNFLISSQRLLSATREPSSLRPSRTFALPVSFPGRRANVSARAVDFCLGAKEFLPGCG